MANENQTTVPRHVVHGTACTRDWSEKREKKTTISDVRAKNARVRQLIGSSCSFKSGAVLFVRSASAES